MSEHKKDHAYMAICRECGNVAGITSDANEPERIKSVIEFLRDGLIITHVTIEYVRAGEYDLGCVCGREEETGQMALPLVDVLDDAKVPGVTG